MGKIKCNVSKKKHFTVVLGNASSWKVSHQFTRVLEIYTGMTRATSVIPIMSKVLEKYFCEQLCNHLKDDELHQLQSGFRKLFFDQDSINSINRSIIP